jgi:hypothetical protein
VYELIEMDQCSFMFFFKGRVGSVTHSISLVYAWSLHQRWKRFMGFLLHISFVFCSKGFKSMSLNWQLIILLDLVCKELPWMLSCRWIYLYLKPYFWHHNSKIRELFGHFSPW